MQSPPTSLILKELSKGAIWGLLVPFIVSFFLFMVFQAELHPFEYFKYMRRYDIFGPLIRLSMLADAIPFFLLLNKHKYYRARGVLMAVFLWGAYIVFLWQIGKF